MALIFYVIISWFVITYFVTNVQKNDIIKSIIIYMLLIILVVSVSTILSLNLQLIDFSKEKTKFFAVALHRNIVIPLLFLDFINKFNRVITYKEKIALAILLLLLFEVLEFINIELQIYTYVKWSFLLDIFLKSFYIFIVLILNKWVHIIQLKEK